MSSIPPSATGPTPAPAPAPKGSKKSTKTATKAGGAGTQAKARKPARRKKTTSKASSAASAQAIFNDARAAQVDLAKQRAQAAARKSDPLWYRIEDILPAVKDGSAMTAKASVLPEQVQVVETALTNNGLSHADITPQAMACLLEQARRYALEIVSDAQDYAYIANRHEISRADVLLAAEMRADHPVAITTQLPKLNLVAQQVNKAPLPPIPSQCYSGILLPPKAHQLTARTYDIINGAQVAQKMVQKAPSPPKKKQSSTTTGQPAYGASRGRQIPIKLKGQTSSTVSQPSMSSSGQPITKDGPKPMDTSGSEVPPSSTATVAPVSKTMISTSQAAPAPAASQPLSAPAPSAVPRTSAVPGGVSAVPGGVSATQMSGPPASALLGPSGLRVAGTTAATGQAGTGQTSLVSGPTAAAPSGPPPSGRGQTAPPPAAGAAPPGSSARP